ncbi:MAG: hypothetical protein JWP01_2730 [Myxococcales bacterium]|nr:hypothetical protein [Myxococcales bacterium]
MRFAATAAVLLLATTSALAQPGADYPQQGYGPPPPPPAPTSQPTYAPPAPAPQVTPPPPSQPYPPQGDAPPQPYSAPQPYPTYQQGYQPQPYPAYAPVGGVTKPAIRPAKSESTATWLAIGATAAGLAATYVAVEEDNENLGVAGIALALIGPSAGHFYAGENGRAVKMSLLRTGGLLMMVYGAEQASNYAYDCQYDCNYNDNNDGETAMLVGGAIILGATLYDFYDAGRAARRTNEKAARALTVAPTMMSSQGVRSPGVALSGQF